MKPDELTGSGSTNAKTARDMRCVEEATVEICGRAATMEAAFERAAKSMCAVALDPTGVRARHTVPVSFVEADTTAALMRWLQAILRAELDYGLVFGEFHLSREGAHWRGCMSGEPAAGKTREARVRSVCAGGAVVMAVGDGWEVRCPVIVERPRTAIRDARAERAPRASMTGTIA